ncbi:hypothetical protein L861_03735 [Litchfieldella anticariensis FP35 = DSM 16096]|uniref:DUF3306 domain-containing protein n=1 Tax=Litchfieldella anticariensis (strain DSM 16096 / CECT 5854 / CIP 108499 / LMG 22089 / FP35) TaxID=1121939 RepID=S2KQV7_LITA3|nr:DUF3306 domain-containing protein [Halomonas anticariensis]EPC04447.1 hypothetical protein L861_03735 [Halomonas anticariensis FP35 = DSM 16096]
MNRLSRWSQRKLGAKDADNESEYTEQAEEPVTPIRDQADIKPATQEDTEPSDLEPGSLDDTLPDPDTLPPGSDIKAFMVPGVSAGLRKRALRRLFAAERYGIRDGLDDYDDDYQQRLKPLASEVAQRLRKWTDKLDETSSETAETNHEAKATNEQAAAAKSANDGDTPEETPDLTITAPHDSESHSTTKH